MTIKISSAKLNKNNRKFYNKDRTVRYNYSIKGMIYRMYSHQIKSSERRNHLKPNYTRESLHQWMVSQIEFKILYLDWATNNFNVNLKPSCDRLNDYLPYTFDNIRLVTWDENNKKAHQDRRNGINNKHSIAVIGTNIKTGEVKEFHSTMEAERQTGADHGRISKCCKGVPIKNGFLQNGNVKYKTVRTVAGWKWEYKN